MDRFFYNLQKTFSKNKLVFSLFFGLFIIALVFFASRIQLSENASAILPKSSADNELNEILENINFSERIFFNIYLSDTSQVNTKELINVAEQLKANIEAKCDEEIDRIQLQVENQSIQDVSNYVLSNLPFLLTEEDYTHFD